MTAPTYFDGLFSVRPHTLRLNVSATEDIASNTSTVYWSLEVYRLANRYPWGSDGSKSVTINGVAQPVGPVPFSYNFNNYSYLLLASGSVVIPHDANGAKSIAVSATAYLGTAAGSASTGGTYVLNTIPRATQPTVSPTSGETGSTFTIGHDAATDTFYHDVAYSFDGVSFTDIITGLAGTDLSTDWTPAHSLLPNSESGIAVIRVITRSSPGGTIIGTKTVNLPLTVPASVKPTISSVTFTDGQTSTPDIPTMMGGAGRFVQGWTRLLPTVTSAGAGGSTIVGSAVAQGGQTTPSGTPFALPVNSSGAVPYSAVVVDSRGRSSDPYINTIAVAAYNFPNLPTPIVTRTSDAGGATPSPSGTYLAITPLASVSSLIFGAAQKNLLEWRVRIKPVGGSYTTVQNWTNASVSGNTWTTKYVAGGYSASTEYIVEVSIRDVFGKDGYNTASTVVTRTINVPSESVFMDWDQDLGIGLGKYRQGDYMLDVAGDINTDGNLNVDGNVHAAGGFFVGALAVATQDSVTDVATDLATYTLDITPRVVALETARAARLTKSTAQSTSGTANTPAAVNFQADSFSSGMYAGANPTRITPNKAGKWRVRAHITGGASTAALYGQVRMNGTANAPSEDSNVDNVKNPTINPYDIFVVTNVGTDYFEVWVASTGSSHSLTVANCSFTAEYIGA